MTWTERLLDFYSIRPRVHWHRHAILLRVVLVPVLTPLSYNKIHIELQSCFIAAKRPCVVGDMVLSVLPALLIKIFVGISNF
jgi:hypothetical protein